MSLTKKYQIPCPQCKNISEVEIFHCINTTSTINAFEKILKDEINFTKCNHCGNRFFIKTHLLYCNHNKKIAIYYNPLASDNYGSDVSKDILGKSSHIANHLKFKDWNEFKNKIQKIEQIETEKSEEIDETKKYSDEHFYSEEYSDYDDFWTCNICGGDSSTGCLYFDPTECPRQ
ncbi:MAG: CpXC domain-containing protein [Bacteroidota bacterium]